jgi:hypothetical protein
MLDAAAYTVERICALPVSNGASTARRASASHWYRLELVHAGLHQYTLAFISTRWPSSVHAGLHQYTLAFISTHSVVLG